MREGAGLNQGPPWEQALASNLCGTRPRPVTFMGPGWSEQPPLEQAQANGLHQSRPKYSDLCWSRPKKATSIGAGLNDLQDCRETQRSAKQTSGMPSDLGVTRTMTLTPPQGATI